MSEVRKKSKGIIVKDTQTTNGMLYKNTKVVVKERSSSKTKRSTTIMVEDAAGRCYWVSNADILIE